jgi:GTP cyclohydrolase III
MIKSFKFIAHIDKIDDTKVNMKTTPNKPMFSLQQLIVNLTKELYSNLAFSKD